MDNRLSRRTKEPKLEWDGNQVSVSLPDKLDRTIEAQWTPTVTSIVRIRERGDLEWSPGFETIFNNCSFIGLKPDTQYEMQVTHKNDDGESKPILSYLKTRP